MLLLVSVASHSCSNGTQLNGKYGLGICSTVDNNSLPKQEGEVLSCEGPCLYPFTRASWPEKLTTRERGAGEPAGLICLTIDKSPLVPFVLAATCSYCPWAHCRESETRLYKFFQDLSVCGSSSAFSFLLSNKKFGPNCLKIPPESLSLLSCHTHRK